MKGSITSPPENLSSADMNEVMSVLCNLLYGTDTVALISAPVGI